MRYNVLSAINANKLRCLRRYRCTEVGCNRPNEGSSSADKTKTSILFLHHGQPRTFYYAKQHLATNYSDFFKIPRVLAQGLANVFWQYSSKTKKAIGDHQNIEILNSMLQKYSKAVEDALSQIVPEFGPFQCSVAYLYDNPSIGDKIGNIIKGGAERVVLFPLYPHFSCYQTGFLFNDAMQSIQQYKSATTTQDKKYPECSAIDRWSSNPALFNFWEQILQDRLKSCDSILFVATHLQGYDSLTYKRDVWAHCQRLMDYLDNVVPWRLAWYSSWNQLNFPLYESIASQIKFFQRNVKFRTLIVPVTSIFPTLDSESVLPNIIEKSNYETVQLIHPPNFSKVLVQGITEQIKNHLLGRSISAQAMLICKYCRADKCFDTREALMPSDKIFGRKKII